MRRTVPRTASGITLVEVLVVIAILSVLIAITIPAVQSAREAARRAQCMDNMRQFGLAFQGVESQQGAFPAVFSGRVKGPVLGDSQWQLHNYMVELLPFLEADAVSSQYHREGVFCAAENATAIATVLAPCICPSAPHSSFSTTTTVVPSLYVSKAARIFSTTKPMWPLVDKKYTTTYTAAITDYAVVIEVDQEIARQYGYDFPPNFLAGLQGMFPWPFETVEGFWELLNPVLDDAASVDFGRRPRSAEISDGLAQTLMLTEAAGRPQHWQNGAWTGTNEPLYAAWADPHTNLKLFGVTTGDGRCFMQCDNQGEIYSFHPAGVNFLFADGHVETVPANTDPRILLAWLTPNRGDKAP